VAARTGYWNKMQNERRTVVQINWRKRRDGEPKSKSKEKKDPATGEDVGTFLARRRKRPLLGEKKRSTVQEELFWLTAIGRVEAFEDNLGQTTYREKKKIRLIKKEG